MSEQETILNNIKEAVLSVDETADVLLFGSRARGDFDDESDWDILILTNEEVNDALRLDFIGMLLNIELEYKIAISPIVKTRTEWYNSLNTDLYINIYEDGFVL